MNIPTWIAARAPARASAWAADAFGLAVLTVIALWPALAAPDRLLQGVDMHVFYGWELSIRRAFEAGQWPLWNPYAFGGHPSIADIQTGLFYPPSVALRWLPINSFFAWNVAFHLWLTGVGAYATCRVIGLGRPASLVAGLALATGGTVSPRLYMGHYNIIFTFAWLPLSFALMIQTLRRPGKLLSPALVLVLACAVLAGFPQVTLYVAGWLGLYMLYVLIWPDRQQPSHRLDVAAQGITGALLVGGLTAFFLVPGVRLAAEAGRAMGLDYDVAINGALTLSDLTGLVFPQSMPGRSVTWDGSPFVGLIPLAFAPLAWLTRRHRRFVAFAGALVVLSVLFALGRSGGLYWIQHAFAPGFRIPNRVPFLASFGLTLLGAIGLDLFLGGRGTGRPAGRVLWVPIATLVAVPLLVMVTFDVRPTGEDARGWALGLAAVTAMAVGRRVGSVTVPMAVCLVFVAIGSVRATRPFVDTRTLDTPAVVEGLGDLASGRVVSACEGQLGASDLLRAAVPTPDGYGDLPLGYYARFINAVTQRGNSVQYGRIDTNTTEWPVRADLLAWLNVTHVVNCGPAPLTELRPVGLTGELSVFEFAQTRPRAFLACGAKRVSDDEAASRLRDGRYDLAGRLSPYVPRVTIRWAEDVSDMERAAREREHGLTEPMLDRGRTWRYSLVDGRPENVRALIADPAVEDTDNGIDRHAGTVVSRFEEPSAGEGTWLVEGDDCTVEGQVTVAARDRPDGYLDLDVTTSTGGLLVMSEPFWVERRVFVNGRLAPAKRVNLTFTGVRLMPGHHRVELRMRPTSLYVGTGVSLVTVAVWIVLMWRRRAASVGEPARAL